MSSLSYFLLFLQGYFTSKFEFSIFTHFVRENQAFNPHSHYLTVHS